MIGPFKRILVIKCGGLIGGNLGNRPKDLNFTISGETRLLKQKRRLYEK